MAGGLVYVVGSAGLDAPNDTDLFPTTPNAFQTTRSSTDGFLTVLSDPADLAVTKTASASSVVAGTPVTYTVTITNNGAPSGSGAASGITLTDTLPAGATFDSASITPITVTPTAAGTLNNTATVASDTPDPTTSDNSSSTSSTVIAPTADVSITKADFPDPVTTGGALGYTLTVSNVGPSPATSVTVSDPLPAGTTLQSSSASQGSCSGSSTVTCNLHAHGQERRAQRATNVTTTDKLPSGLTFVSATATQGSCTNASGTVTCNLGSLASGATATVTIKTTPTKAAALVNTATVKAAETDPKLTNNVAIAASAVVR